MPRPTILAFNLPDARLSRLRFLCMKLGLLVQVVPQEDFTQPLSALAGLTERRLPPLEEVDGQSPDGEGSPEADAFSDEMIVFCHMTNAQLNNFLKTAKQQRIPPFPLKAILTPTNASWTAIALCAELKEERAAVLSGSQAHQPE